MCDNSFPDSRLSSILEENNRNNNNCYLTQSFAHHFGIENFIRDSGLIKIVKTVSEDFFNHYYPSKRPEDRFAAIIVRLPLEYTAFLNGFLDLLHFIIDEPEQFAEAAKYCVFSLFRNFVKDLSKTNTSEGGDAINIDIDQFHVLIRFMGLPLQEDLCFQPHANSYQTGLTEVIGILSAVTEPAKVVIQSVWYCSNGCERNKIRTYSLDVPSCTSCRHPMNEYPKLRHTQICRFLRILPAESIEPPHKLNKLFRAITVRLDIIIICL